MGPSCQEKRTRPWSTRGVRAVTLANVCATEVISVVAARTVAVLTYAYGPRSLCFVACASCNTKGRGKLSSENSPRPGLVVARRCYSEALKTSVPRGAHGVRVGDQLIADANPMRAAWDAGFERL